MLSQQQKAVVAAVISRDMGAGAAVVQPSQIVGYVRDLTILKVGFRSTRGIEMWPIDYRSFEEIARSLGQSAVACPFIASVFGGESDRGSGRIAPLTYRQLQAKLRGIRDRGFPLDVLLTASKAALSEEYIRLARAGVAA